MTCRSCGEDLEDLISLGNLVCSGFVKPGFPDPPKAPLDLMVCGHCQLVQLGHSVPADQLFSGDYWYRSSLNEVMQAELRDVVRTATDEVGRIDKPWVLDIGANDGYLLAQYPLARKIAVEPSKTFT